MDHSGGGVGGPRMWREREDGNQQANGKKKKQQCILMQLLTKKQLIEKKLNKFLSCATALVASNFICASLL